MAYNITMTPDVKLQPLGPTPPYVDLEDIHPSKAVGPTPPYVDLERAIHPTKVLAPVPPYVDLERAIHPTKVLAPTPAFTVPTVQGVFDYVKGTAIPFVLSGTFIVGLLAGYIMRDTIKKNVVQPVVGVVSKA